MLSDSFASVCNSKYARYEKHVQILHECQLVFMVNNALQLGACLTHVALCISIEPLFANKSFMISALLFTAPCKFYIAKSVIHNYNVCQKSWNTSYDLCHRQNTKPHPL